jgi:hypothetical protein
MPGNNVSNLRAVVTDLIERNSKNRLPMRCEESSPYRPHNELSPPHITLRKFSTVDAQGLSTVELVFILN